jgi:hypothetical protein
MSDSAEPPAPEPHPPSAAPPPEWARTEPAPGFAPLDEPSPTTPHPPAYGPPPAHPYAQPQAPYPQAPPAYGQSQPAPYAAPPPYGPPATYQTGYVPYQYGYGAPRIQTNGLSIAALVCGIVGAAGMLMCQFPGIIGAGGVVCGILSLRQLKRAPVPQQGRGMAIAGIATGAVGVAGFLLFVLFFGAILFGGFLGA